MKKSLSEIKVKRIGHSPYYQETFYALERSELETIPKVVVLPHDSVNSSDAPEHIDIAITNTHVPCNLTTLPNFLNTKLIVHTNSGYDNFTTDFVKNFSGQIILGNEIRKDAVANYILSALFKHYSSIPAHADWHKTRKWPRKLLKEQTVLILGYGHIGKLIYHSLLPLCQKVIVVDPFSDSSNLNFEKIDQIKNVDIVIPLCGLNPTSKHLINHAFLEKLNPGFLLINASRGEVVNTEDLIHQLKKDPEAFAFLDVFEKEPTNFSHFNDLENLNTTSHIAGVFKNIDETTIHYEKKIIFDFVSLSATSFEEKYKNENLKNKIKNDYLI